MSRNKPKPDIQSSKITPRNNPQQNVRSPSPSSLAVPSSSLPSTPTFQFLSDRHSLYLNCPLCTKLMIQPIRLHRCGHTFCSTCIQHKQKDIKNCPICLIKIQTKQKDILAGRLVGQLPVRCLNVGCPWRGSYEEFCSFHQKGCKLKIGGIQAWLRNLKTVINQNAVYNQEQEHNQKQQREKNIINEFQRQQEQNNQNQQKAVDRKQQHPSDQKDGKYLFRRSNIHEQSQKQKQEIKLMFIKKTKQFQQ